MEKPMTPPTPAQIAVAESIAEEAFIGKTQDWVAAAIAQALADQAAAQGWEEFDCPDCNGMGADIEPGEQIQTGAHSSVWEGGSATPCRTCNAQGRLRRRPALARSTTGDTR